MGRGVGEILTRDILPLVRAGDLVIRDLGYLVADTLQEISRIGAYFLSRHLGKRVLHHVAEHGGQEIDLLGHLRRHAPHKGDCVDLDVIVGSGQHGAVRLESRLVARRLPQAVVDARLRKAHLEEKRRGKKFTKLRLDLLGWETSLTNLPRAEADVAKVAAIYRLRWRIEIVFKALKSYTPGPGLAAHCSNANHIQVLVIAWLCLVVLAMRTGGFALAVPKGAGGPLAPNCLRLLKVIPKVFQFLGLILFTAYSPDLSPPQCSGGSARPNITTATSDAESARTWLSFWREQTTLHVDHLVPGRTRAGLELEKAHLTVEPWQEAGHAGSGSGLALEFDLTAVLAHDAADDEKAEA